MRKKIVLSVYLLLFFACKANLNDKPENLISKNKMTDVLYDMYLLNASKNLNKIEFENNHLNPEQYIFKKYNIDSIQFAESNTYYTNNLKLYKDIIAEVQNRIKIKKEEIDTLLKREREEKKRLRDSLNKLPDSLKAKIKDDIKKSSTIKPINTKRLFTDSISKSKK